MRLDDEQPPGRLAFLILALAGAFMLFFLMAARLPGSALSYSGGTTAEPYTMSTSWAPSLAANSDEFTTDTSANWTLQAVGGTGTTVIDPLATPSVSLFNFATFRPGWLFIQAESGTGAAMASKAYTLPTNFAMYSRVFPGKREGNLTSSAAQDGHFALMVSATSGGVADTNNMVRCSIQRTETNTRLIAVQKVQAGVLTDTPTPSNVTTTYADDQNVILVQKRSSVYHCWICRTMSGSCGWVGSQTWSGVATLDRIGFYTRNEATTTPGPLTMSADYFRVVEGDNVLP